MPIISGGGGGGGGTPFNGGTITDALAIDGATVAGSTLLDIFATGLANWDASVARVDTGGGAVDVRVSLSGSGAGRAFLDMRNGTGDSITQVGSDTITLASNSNMAGDTLFELASVFWGTLLQVFSEATVVGAPMKFLFPPVLQNHAAPADASLAAGDCALWFDQTNGVGNTKLMAKGKSADGTVKTAAVAVLA